MLKPGQELKFKYSGLFQSVIVNFKTTETAVGYTITVSADIKLPILKKTYQLSTDFSKDSLNWLSHVPVHETHQSGQRVEKTQEFASALDPITFFMKLHSGEWAEPNVQMLIGKKLVNLEVNKLADGYQVKRKDKDQQLIVRKDSQGIKTLEVPVPVLGSLKISRS